jgi:RNA polymerase sigma-70 factor (ECF subfamily)
MWSAVHKFDPDRASVTSWAVTITRHRAVERLPVEQRDLIRLAFLDGRTHAAIAAQLGLPLGTVKGRVRNGLKRLCTDMKAEV